MSKISVKKKIDGEIPGKKLREKFAEMFELPKELVLDFPKLTIVGNGDMMVENYKSLVEYGKAKVRLNTGLGIIRITGTELVIKEITAEDVIISGKIISIEFASA